MMLFEGNFFEQDIDVRSCEDNILMRLGIKLLLNSFMSTKISSDLLFYS